MIGIRVEDEFLDLPDGISFDVVLNNPLFKEDNLSPGSGTYPFEVPGDEVSEKNARILANPDVLEQSGGTRKIDGELHIDGSDFKKGKVVVRDASGGNININFAFGLAQVSDEFKTKKLRELADQPLTIGSTAVAKKIFIKPGTAAAAPYRIDVNGRNYEAATLAALATAITNDTKEPRATATLVNTGTTPLGLTAPFIEIAPTNNPNDPLSPLHVNNPVDNGNGGSFVWLTDTFDPAAYNTDFVNYFNSPPTGHSMLRWPLVFNRDMYGEGQFFQFNAFGGPTGAIAGGTKDYPYVNAFTSTFGLIFNVPNLGVGVNIPFLVSNRNSLQPFVRLGWVLDQILTYFGLELEGDWRDADVDNMLIDNAAPLDEPMNFLGTKKFVFWRRQFNVKDLLPDITVVEFFRALQSRYNLGIYLNEKNGKLRIVKLENIARSYLQEDITAQAGRINMRTDERLTGFTLRAKRAQDDALSVEDTYVVGESEKVYEMALSGLGDQIAFDNLIGIAGTVQGPAKAQKMSDNFPFRIFYDLGLQSAGAFNYRAASINASGWAEKLDNELFKDGIYKTFWKYWLLFEANRRSVKLPVNFYLRQLRHFDWELKRVLDRKYFLVKSIRARVSNNGVEPSDVELYTMF